MQLVVLVPQELRDPPVQLVKQEQPEPLAQQEQQEPLAQQEQLDQQDLPVLQVPLALLAQLVLRV